MKFNLLKNNKNTANLNSDINERTREKFILKGWIESNRKPTCTNKRTRGFLFGAQTPFKRDFSVGRSMVEMLGVLAIIGVLSIGGIQGYTIAMRKYKANEIVNAMHKFATVVYTGFLNKKINNPNSTMIVFKKYDHQYPSYPVYACLVDEEDSFAEDDNGSYSIDACVPISDYTNSGLGALVNGVDRMIVTSIVSQVDANGNSTFQAIGSLPNVTLTSDYVSLRVEFSNNDKALCETTLNMLSMYPGYSYVADESACDSQGNADESGKSYIYRIIPVN